MNKLFYVAISLYMILLLIFGRGLTSFGFFILLFATGLVINILKINEITKSRNTFKAKVYFSFIFSLLTFSLMIFFWLAGKNPLFDEFGIGSMVTTIAACIGSIISFILGIIFSFIRRDVLEYDYNIKSISFFSTIFIIVILILSFYNLSVSAVSRALQNENLCYFTLAVSDNSALFNTGYKDSCFVEVARQKLDVSVCKKVSGFKTGCYIAVAAEKNDPSICRKGIEEGIQGMGSCFSIATEKTGIISPEDLVSAVQICESINDCGSFTNMETSIFNILNNPNDAKLMYAIKATKYMWGEGQRTKAIPLLKNLLTTASLENKKSSMDSLLDIIKGSMDFKSGKKELNQILPLIENQSGLADYTDQVKQRISAELLTPTQTKIFSTPN